MYITFSIVNYIWFITKNTILVLLDKPGDITLSGWRNVSLTL